MANRFKLVLCEKTRYTASCRAEEWSGGRLASSRDDNLEWPGGTTEIWVDTKTNIQYLFHHEGSYGGFTVLLGPDGKPLLYRH